MMTNLLCDVLCALNGRTLVTAESCTGGAIGAALTDIPGSSAVYKGGIICYTNDVKIKQLGVDEHLLVVKGAVSSEVACQMACGVRLLLRADVAISVTGLAGPGGDEFGNPLGTVYIGYSDELRTFSQKYLFHGDRAHVRQQALEAALMLLLHQCIKTSKEDEYESN